MFPKLIKVPFRNSIINLKLLYCHLESALSLYICWKNKIFLQKSIAKMMQFAIF